jgi:hypothetical protein
MRGAHNARCDWRGTRMTIERIVSSAKDQSRDCHAFRGCILRSHSVLRTLIMTFISFSFCWNKLVAGRSRRTESKGTHSRRQPQGMLQNETLKPDSEISRVSSPPFLSGKPDRREKCVQTSTANSKSVRWVRFWVSVCPCTRRPNERRPKKKVARSKKEIPKKKNLWILGIRVCLQHQIISSNARQN